MKNPFKTFWNWLFPGKPSEVKSILKSIRSEFAFMGFDLSDMSDEEISNGIVNAQKRFQNCGFTVDEFIQASKLLGKALNSV